ncbi:interferon a3 [Ictalurus punctatus]|uniref:Interferon a3 n=1 Tax=Ictalurus punctatus TaxID=7998 RepID=A0A979E0M1_ICTPU|nr:interferon a3 [Ictalurus punctatus]
MTVLNVWVFIVIALNSWNCARACAWMKTQNKATLSNFQVLSTNSIVHLQQACRDAGHDHGHLIMEFPNKQYNLITHLQANDHILFILRTLKGVMRIYRRKSKEMNCDQHKLRIFLLEVDRQILELERCARYIVTDEVHKRMFKEMEIHFRSLVSHLRNTEYNAKSWNDVAGVILKHLQRLDLLATTTKTILN